MRNAARRRLGCWMLRMAVAVAVSATAIVFVFLGAIAWDLRQAEHAWGAIHSGPAFSREGDLYRSVNHNMVEQSFPARKPAVEFRAFVLGSSEAMGTPYVHQDINRISGSLFNMPNEGGISTWLEKYLQRQIPERSVRVVNAAKGGRDLAESVARSCPSANPMS
jgi:hypothetical protein